MKRMHYRPAASWAVCQISFEDLKSEVGSDNPNIYSKAMSADIRRVTCPTCLLVVQEILNQKTADIAKF